MGTEGHEDVQRPYRPAVMVLSVLEQMLADMVWNG